MFADMQQNEHVQSLAKALAKDPEHFADIIISGKINEVYKGIKQKMDSPNRTENIDLEKNHEPKPVAEEHSLGGNVPVV